MQIMIQLVAHANQAEQLKHWCLNELGAGLAHSAELDKVIVNLAISDIELLPYGKSESLQGEAMDVMIQLWPKQGTAPSDVLKNLLDKLAQHARTVHIYQLTDTEVLNRQASQNVQQVSRGIKIMRGLFLYDDLSDVAAQRMWAHHSKLAAKVHIGLSRYARHWVEEVITPNSPKIRGISDLHFPDLDSIQQRYFDSERGREEITHDIGHFIQDGTVRFFGIEHILKTTDD